MPKKKKQKEYSTSYEKKISINPMTEAFSMGEDESPTIGGAIGMATKRVGEFTPSGRAITAMRKNPKTSVGTAGALAGTGAGYAAGRYDEKNSYSKSTPSEMGLEDESLKPGAEYLEKAKGGMTKAQKKVGTVMREFKKGKLHSGKKGPVVKNPKQAIAIALSEAGMSKKKMMGGGMMSDGIANRGSGIEMKSKGGMVRGQGIAIRGTKFKGIF